MQERVRQITPGIDVELVVGDLGTESGIEALMAHLDGRVIDVLVNNAGFGTYGPLSEADAGREHDMVAVNVDALVRLTRAVLPGMVDTRYRRHLERCIHDRVPARPVSSHLWRLEGVRAFVQPGPVGRDEGLGGNRDRVVPRAHAHRLRRRARFGRLTHRDLSTPRRT